MLKYADNFLEITSIDGGRQDGKKFIFQISAYSL